MTKYEKRKEKYRTQGEYRDKILKQNRDRARLRRQDPVLLAAERAKSKLAKRSVAYKTTALLRFWKKNYGLDAIVVCLAFAAQAGKCAICGKPLNWKKLFEFSGRKGSTNFHIDHCHKTGNARGILCLQCNIALGALEDDIGRIDKAKHYLAKATQ